MDPILRYYGLFKDPHFHSHNFLLPHTTLDIASLFRLKKRIQLSIKNSGQGVEIELTPQQFIQFKSSLSWPELIFWHGNQLVTGAPFIAGGIPHVDFIQWGNLFGIVKYAEIAGEKLTKGNILVYFVDRQDKNLTQCVKNYYQQLAVAYPQPTPVNELQQPLELSIVPTLSLRPQFLSYMP